MLKQTALHGLHLKKGAKLASFAGFELPLYYPSGALKEHQMCRKAAAQKYWPPVGRVDNAYGDRNLFCTCPPVSSFDEVAE